MSLLSGILCLFWLIFFTIYVWSVHKQGGTLVYLGEFANCLPGAFDLF